ncbi:efflux RND transporter periplasmic adaptor subunit [Gemmata sp. JC717]|uniref:efflux RND transporter periplasmic adaptor subunit n=1 Tax=Gemmata algarum TaxID=2975278 RepID=UPI0021BBB40D|nr:efflux RND transporter periplasmic adaptor subunit [Gemmata algarum]MDY3554708.1 efflux RND transporter periplasmic adaptor subunit [Gemmata algarum]
MSAQPSSLFRRSRLVLLALAAAGGGAGVWFATRAKPLSAGEGPTAGVAKPAVTVEVIHPRAGGIDRVCVQPGTVEPFQSADLYSKVSGFLAEQTVNIGSRVQKGDVLARIAVPEQEKQVERDRARLNAAEAKVRQVEAHVLAAESEAKSADASVALAKSMVRAKGSYRQYREKQLTRYKDLAKQQAIEPRVVDEQEDFFLSAQEAENEAKESVNAATERAATARAKITQAKADLEQAKAEVGVAQAELGRAEVLLNYTTIRSPYTGVVTRRSFQVGDFIRSADQGGAIPLLSVERTDLMTVVVQVPDRDVPLVNTGDPAVLVIDALGGQVFDTRGVSRCAESEDTATRTMRTEIDVPNPDGRLRRGMYGRVTLKLQTGAASAVRVPTAAVVSRSGTNHGAVRVVRGDHVATLPVTLGADNGVEIEVAAGLSAADQVVLRASGAVEDGTAVAVAGAAGPAAGH